jgi:hypothetical protein
MANNNDRPNTTIINPSNTTSNETLVAGVLTKKQVGDLAQAAVEAVDGSTSAAASAPEVTPPTSEIKAAEQAVKDAHAEINNYGDDATKESTESTTLNAEQTKLTEQEEVVKQGGRRRTKHKKSKSSKKVAKRRKSKSGSKKSRRSSRK